MTVDWSRVASNIIYPIAAVQTFQVGVQIGEMIDGMIAKRMMTLDKIHIIGHSLGAHVAGAAGSNCKTGKVYRVTGKIEIFARVLPCVMNFVCPGAVTWTGNVSISYGN